MKSCKITEKLPPKRGNGNYPGCCGNGELVIPIYANSLRYPIWCHKLIIYVTLHIVDRFYVRNCYCLEFHLRWSYLCNIYNLIAVPTQMLVTNHFLPI